MLVPSSLHNEYVPIVIPELSADARARAVDREQRAAVHSRRERDVVATAARASRVAEAVRSAELRRMAVAGYFSRIV